MTTHIKFAPRKAYLIPFAETILSKRFAHFSPDYSYFMHFFRSHLRKAPRDFKIEHPDEFTLVVELPRDNKFFTRFFLSQNSQREFVRLLSETFYCHFNIFLQVTNNANLDIARQDVIFSFLDMYNLPPDVFDTVKKYEYRTRKKIEELHYEKTVDLSPETVDLSPERILDFYARIWKKDCYNTVEQDKKSAQQKTAARFR